MVESILLAWHHGYLLLLVAATVSLDSDSLPPLPCSSPYIVGTTFTTVHILLLLSYFFLHLKFLHSSILMFFIFLCVTKTLQSMRHRSRKKSRQVVNAVLYKWVSMGRLEGDPFASLETLSGI